MKYRATQEFMRIEAIGPRTEVNSDPADPIWLHVRVTPGDDVNRDIESALMQGVDPHGVTVTERSKFPYRLSTGLWAFDLDPLLYEVGKTYTIHWRHSTQPQVMNVLRSNFIWQPVPQLPHEPENCVLSGVLSRIGGVPVPGARIVIEQYKDFVTLSHRMGSLTVTTDAFGVWYVEVPRNSIQRVIFGEQIRTVVIPDVAAITLKDAKEYQPSAKNRLDAFGYPIPAEIPEAIGKPAEIAPQPEPDIVPGGGPTNATPPRVPETFEFVQATPSTAWIISHPLTGKPSVTVVDTDGEEITGDVAYPTAGLVVVSFLIPIAGTARLN